MAGMTHPVHVESSAEKMAGWVLARPDMAHLHAAARQTLRRLGLR